MEYPLVSESTGKFFEEWGFIIHSEEDPDGGYYGWERWQLNAVKKGDKKWSPKDHKRIWSVVESGDCGCMWITAGERLVNVVHHMVSTKPWEDLTMEWLDYKCIECQEKEREK